MLIDIGTKESKAKATHFFANKSTPIINSNKATVFKIYPVATKEDKKAAAFSGGTGNGIKGCGSSIFNPNKTRIPPSILLTILVNMEFIIGWFKGSYKVNL